jgi:hypothetical protein
MTGAGAVAASASVLVPEVMASTTTQVDETEWHDPSPHHSGELVVAYLQDAEQGHVVVVAGEHEIRVVDKVLASRLTKIAKEAR